MTLNDNTLIRVFGGFAAVCVAAGLGVLFNYDGDKVQAFGLLGGLILLFIPTLLGFKKSADAAGTAQKAADIARAATEQSQQNGREIKLVAATVAPLADAVADNTDLTTRTKELVNGQSVALRNAAAEVARLSAIIAREEGVKEGIQQAADAAAPTEPPE